MLGIELMLIIIDQSGFLPERALTTLRSGRILRAHIRLSSVVCLLPVTFVRPTQGLKLSAIFLQHLRPSGLFSCRPHSLELSPGLYPGPDHQCRLS